MKKLLLACLLVLTSLSLAETKPVPDEAQLHQHLTNAFRNPKEEPGKPRVLLLGDSISIGYTTAVRRRLEVRALVFRAPVNCQQEGVRGR